VIDYDALLFVSFGGPEGPDDVVPFMENVTRGRGIPRERLVEVSAHYQLFGGVSPINGQNRALIAALSDELAARGTALPIYWGNRNWAPMLGDAVEQMAADGVKRALAFVTSAYSSASGCRQYREDIARACAAVPGAPVVDKIRVFYNHPGFVEPMVDSLRATLAELSDDERARVELAMCAHSIPMSMADTSDYVVQLTETARLVAESGAPGVPWSLVFQSRSGPPTQPWLEPDISDHLTQRSQAGASCVVMVPIGFISDHMEVVYDLDTQAMAHARDLNLPVRRCPTVGTDPRFVSMIAELIDERRSDHPVRRVLGVRPANHDVCPEGCCPLPTRPTGPPAATDARPGQDRPAPG
jgi:protoporphyrin/coproporphyrin ferrochelatase